MELSEKIQKLRKERGMTQEQFAERLFVSRTAVSKWETGRGMPSMESLQQIAKLGGITLDELLRAEEVITIAENENKERLCRFSSILDGIMNLTSVLGILLPLYRAEADGMIYTVPLYQYQNRFAVIYWLLPLAIAVCGALQLLIRRSEQDALKQKLVTVSTVLYVFTVFLLILSRQTYPALLFFVLLLLKIAVFLMKQR